MAPRKPASKPEPASAQPLVEVLDDRVLTDNVVKDGVTYPAGTKLSELPPLLRGYVIANETLHAEPDAE
jgi:hypothetical protein